MSDLTLRKSLQLYETVHMPPGGLVGGTRREYADGLADLVRFLEKSDLKRPREVQERRLGAHQAELDSRGYPGSTRRGKTASVRSLFVFLKQDGYVDNNVAQKLAVPRAEQKQPRVLSEREYKDLLRPCVEQIRDAAVIELLLQTEIRLSQLSRLTLRDIELLARLKRSPDTVAVPHVRQGKARRARYLAVNYKACRAVKAYLKIRPDIENDRLFISKFRKPLGPRAFQNIVKKYLDAAGIEHASVHTLRHTFATHHVARGTSSRAVQEAVGHEDLKTACVYVSLAREVMNRELQEHAL